MYSAAAIQSLTDRIGWDAPRQPTSKVLTAEILRSDSGSTFSGFLALAIVEVVEEVMPVSNADTATVSITNDVLNAQLYSMKQQAARRCLRMVFDSNPFAAYNDSSGSRVDLSGTDWSDTIQSRTSLFDELYGLCMAALVLDMCINNTRSNGRQRRTFDMAQIKMEQDGITNENGVLVAKGITHKIAASLADINKILFPQATKKTVIRNASFMW